MAEILLECKDCCITVHGELDKALEVMRSHTKGAHGREPLRTLEQYENPTLATFLEDSILLRPEIMLAA